MNKLLLILLLAAITGPSALAQKKLDLANECYDLGAYSLAARYFQQHFSHKDTCHPDLLKLATSLEESNQSDKAQSIYESYYSCDQLTGSYFIAYGKLLLAKGDHQQAEAMFSMAATDEPEMAKHYLLACKMATGSEVERPRSDEEMLASNDSTESAGELYSSERKPAVNMENVERVVLVSLPATVTNNPKPTPPTTTSEINVAEKAVIPVINKSPNPSSLSAPVSEPRPTVTTTAPTSALMVDRTKSMSPYGIRLGSFDADEIPELSALRAFGKVDQKVWNNKTIIYLLDFESKEAARLTLKEIQKQKFKYATLVIKQENGRLKSIK